MTDVLLYFVKPIKVYILITFVLSIIFLNRNKKENRFLLGILAISLFTEILNSVLLYHEKPIKLSTTLSVICTHVLWLLLLRQNISIKKSMTAIVMLFLVFSIYNLFLIEGIILFNYNTFIVGALLYIIIFIYESFIQLKNENFNFFTSNKYLLIFAPVLFFFGFSFMFGFKSSRLTQITVFGNTNLYTLIAYTVNFIYYSLVNVYIYYDKKINNAR